jgi:predicted phosphodiesterase
MAGTGVLERRARTPRASGPARRRRLLTTLRRPAALALVVLATLAGATIALSSFEQMKRLDAGSIRLSVSPFHHGALDLYVPLVDWGVRFDAIRLPARLHVDLRSVDRGEVARLAKGGSLDIDLLRKQASDAIAHYLEMLIAIAALSGLALGLLVARATRAHWVAAPVTAAIAVVGLIVLLPPRGALDHPQYYAYGPDIPRALDAIESVERSSKALDEELDAQLVGLARLVIAPGRRRPLAGLPTVTIASDLHNNVLALSNLEAVVKGGPLLFPGDLTDRGSPLETSLVERVARLGHPLVFVSGNHDSDSLESTLAQRGAIVLTQDGQLREDGSLGSVIVNVRGLRIAGYSDPFERRAGQDFADRFDKGPTPAMQDAFTAWMRPLLGRVDVIMVHEPALIAPALATLADDPPPRPVVFVVGHTHHAGVQRLPGVTVINGGSVGAGGTGNLTERTPLGLARLTYTTRPGFQPLAADLVTIDPASGSATARRERLDATVR